jgi:hypothetical protein
MFVRLGAAALACASLPMLVQGVAAFSEPTARPAPAAIAAQVATRTGDNPFGALVFHGTQATGMSASAENFRELRDGYFSRMPVLTTMTARSPTRTESRPSGPLPDGCEALGGVATALGKIAGRCLS